MPRKAKLQSIADEQSSQGVAAVNRALSLLAAFQQGSLVLTLSELAERTRLYKSTTLRLLTSLINANLIQRFEDGRYGLSYEVARLYAIYAASFSMEHVVKPVLRDLVAITGESAAYHVRQGTTRFCLYRVDSPHPVRDHIKEGDLLPLKRGAGGRVLQAFETDENSANQSDDDDEDKDLYARIREQGYYSSIGDREQSVGGISAPVFRANGKLVGAVTLTMPAERYDERFIEPVIAAARKLSALI
ncbi:MAG: IclR family transcriptional regulator [Burkholderiaceae bacterium]|nr:MAG: IclR family transcriptional regulator [Burkholderiaceae bacterium]